MQSPYSQPRINNFQQFNPYYNQNSRFTPNPMPPYTQRHPFNRNRVLPVQNYNEEHWCETCDRSFKSLDILENHKQQHQKCNIDGCQFIAHPKVITKHIQMQHASGLYKKIANLNNPEEINKWREERKRKYPTKENIEKKAAEIKEKIDRGEKMGLNKDRHRQFNKGTHPNKKRTSDNIQHNRHRQNSKPNNTLNKIKKPILPKNILPTGDTLRKLKPFAGIQDIVMETMESESEVMEYSNCNFIIEDDDCQEIAKPVQNNAINSTEPKVCGALSSLMCDYDFSDDDTNNLQDEESRSELNKPDVINLNSQTIDRLPTTAKIVSQKIINDNNQNHINSDDDGGPEEIKIEKHTNTPVEEHKVNESKMKKKIFIDRKPMSKNNFAKPKHKIPSTLLQKLLKREMQQERNIVLQCVRHIIKNNYFDKHLSV